MNNIFGEIYDIFLNNCKDFIKFGLDIYFRYKILFFLYLSNIYYFLYCEFLCVYF